MKRLLRLLKLLRRPARHELRPNFAAAEPPMAFYLTLLFFTVSFYTQLGARIEFLGTIRHELLLGFVLLAMSGVTLSSRPPRLAQDSSLVVVVVFFIIAHLIQIPLAADPAQAEYSFTNWVMKNILFSIFIVVLIRSPRMLLGFAAAFVFSLFWIYQEAVRGLISGSLVWYNQGILRLHGSVPLYFHPNGLSLAACTSLPFLFYSLPLFKRFFLVKLFLLGTAVLAGLCIVNTGSRAGYVGVVALVPYWIMEGKGKRKRFLIALLAAIVLIPALPDQYKGRFESIGGEEVQGHSREARIQILEDAWAIWQKYPFGTGIDGFQVVRMRMFGKNQDTHNLYAQIATHLGIQTIIIFGFMVTLMFKSLNRSRRGVEFARATLKRAVRTAPPTDSRSKRRNGSFAFELEATHAVIRATKMLLYFMLVNGLFAHTIYHVAWWFLIGLTLSQAEISQRLAQRARTWRLNPTRESMAADPVAGGASARWGGVRTA